MNRGDIPKAITAEDLIRRFRLFEKDVQAIKTNQNGLTRVENELKEFIESTIGSLENLQNQVDGNIMTWFFSGLPTLENEPAIDWKTDNEKNNHLGDLYYDSETGYAYRFTLENEVYKWLEIKDTDVVKALAVANNAQDTADSKRRVFVSTPFTPYEVGDIWIKEDKELYRCRASRSEGPFEEVDFCLATDYSNDDYAKKVEAVLDQFKTTVETDYVTNVKLETTKDSILSSVESVTTKVETLEKSTNYFSTDLDVYNLTIPCKGYIPLETKDFLINHYSYFKGKQVFVTPTLKEQIEGLTIETTENDIKVSTDSSMAIPSISNELVLTFEYSDESGKYTLQKKVIITLVQKGEDGAKGEDGKDGAQGLQGPPGENGQSTYLHVKYSVNETRSPMVDIPTEDTKYIGIATTTSETPPTAYTAYTWSLIKGADGKNGTNGTPGAPGADGRTPYLHIMYSEDGTTFTPKDEKYALGKKPSDYRGEYVDFDEQDSTNFEDYEWYYLNRNVDGKISDLQSQININDTNANNNYQDVLERLNNYADAESVNTLTQKVETMQSSTEYTIQVLENIQQNGVDRVTTENNFTFDKNGLNIDETGAPVSNTLDSYGMTIEDKHNNEDLLFAGFDTKTNETIVRSKNMTVEKYFSAPHVRIEEYNNPTFGVGTGYFYME